MNNKQKLALMAVGALILGMLLFPPYILYSKSSGKVFNHGYDWIFALPYRSSAYISSSLLASVDIGLLLTQWVGVLLIGGIVFFLLKD
jgi:hypothetical protein